jgi:prepilin-type N-terminal cleavage/methylation domain-containing protein
MTRFKFRTPNGFTLIELLICGFIFGILTAIVADVLSGKSPYRMSDCARSGGSRTELCTYDSGK